VTVDPDEWRPAQGAFRFSRSTSTGRLKPDQIVVWERQPYRVIEVRERDHTDWSQSYHDIWVRHGMPDAATWSYRPRVVVLRHDDQPQAKPLHLQAPDSAYWHVLPEHYWICRRCHEIPPCRHVHNEAVMERATERMEKEMAILPGSCHACREPITKRQKTFTFPGANLIRPDLGDNSAIFHTREKCYNALDAYDKRWAKAEEGRDRLFFCEGTMTVHYDDSAECDNPGCTNKGAPTDLVQHRLEIKHHPRGSREVQGCWCLAAATA
jgi:hypothetical protein